MVSLFEWSQKIERCFGYCHVWLQHYFNANKTNNANKTTPRTNCKSIRIVQVLNQNIPPCSVILGLIVAVREEFANQPWKSGRRTLPASSATERSLFNCKKCNFFQLKGSNSWACWNSKALGWSFSRRGKGGEGGGVTPLTFENYEIFRAERSWLGARATEFYKIALVVIWVLSAVLTATMAIEEPLFHRL